ncbi:MAG: hypothetical protein NC548_44760 [Lachnospiraceae bacterium]|nr:hypothetical protein [Lachnospiraceae bacterium]
MPNQATLSAYEEGDEIEQRILDAYASGDPDYQPYMSQEAPLKELDLTLDLD